MGCSSPREHLDQDPLRLRGWAALASSLNPSYILLLHPKESQAPLWFQKATCSDWSLISPLAPPAGQDRQPASVHLQTPGRGCWALALRASLAGHPSFKKEICLFPCRLAAPLAFQGCLTQPRRPPEYAVPRALLPCYEGPEVGHRRPWKVGSTLLEPQCFC